MGIAYCTDGPVGVSVLSWADNVTPTQAAQHVFDLAAVPDGGASGRILTDLCYVASTSIPNRKQAQALAHLFEEQLACRTSAARWAIIANQAFDKAMYFSDQIREHVRSLIVYFDLHSACGWLDSDWRAMRVVVDELRHEARRSR
jgi:hypothetical protein